MDQIFSLRLIIEKFDNARGYEKAFNAADRRAPAKI